MQHSTLLEHLKQTVKSSDGNLITIVKHVEETLTKLNSHTLIDLAHEIGLTNKCISLPLPLKCPFSIFSYLKENLKNDLISNLVKDCKF